MQNGPKPRDPFTSAIGKKNWLFIGSPEAGARSAIIYSVLITCQRFGIDPHA